VNAGAFFVVFDVEYMLMKLRQPS